MEANLIRVLIVDDDPLVLSSLHGLINGASDFQCVGTATNGVDAVKAVDTMQPDVVLMDVRMPVLDGVEATALIHQRHPDVKVIAWTSLDYEDALPQAFRNGAAGFLLKNCGAQALFDGLRAARSGMTVITQDFEVVGARRPPKVDHPDVSSIDRQILALAGKGLTNAQIGKQLFLAEATIKLHLTGLLRAFGVTNRTALVIAAVRHGLISD